MLPNIDSLIQMDQCPWDDGLRKHSANFGGDRYIHISGHAPQKNLEEENICPPKHSNLPTKTAVWGTPPTLNNFSRKGDKFRIESLPDQKLFSRKGHNYWRRAPLPTAQQISFNQMSIFAPSSKSVDWIR